MEAEWKSIGEARFVKDYTVADLKMPNGRIYRATWGDELGRYFGTAWRLAPGQARKRAIGLYDPVSFRVIASGTGQV